MLWLEVLGAAFALGLLGLYLSMPGRGLVPIVAAAIIVSLLVLVTFDDRPRGDSSRFPQHRCLPRRRR